MKIKIFDYADRDRWNDFIAHTNNFGLLQSWEWGEFKKNMGWTVVRVACENDGGLASVAQLLIRPIAGQHASIAYIPRGPLTDWSDNQTTTCLMNEIHKIAKQHRAIFLKIEPPLVNTRENRALLTNYSFRASPITNQPKNTIIINIQPEPDFILAGMRQKNRQYIKRATREGITVRIGNRKDLPKYLNLLKITGSRQAFSVRSDYSYEKEYECLSANDSYVLLMAECNGEVLACRTVCAYGKHAAEFHAGSIRALDHLHPNYLLVWEGILWARNRGCVTYDMWGIPDELSTENETAIENRSKRNDRLWGVYQFKRGFSQNIVSYVGAYDYIYSKILYRFFSLPFLNRDTIEKLSTMLDPRKLKT